MLYYNVIISWALFYFISSFRSNLLWKQCGNWWNDGKCFVPGDENAPYSLEGIRYNCTRAQFQNQTFYDCVPINSTLVTATEQFYLYENEMNELRKVLLFLVNYYWEKVKVLKILEHLKPMVYYSWC